MLRETDRRNEGAMTELEKELVSLANPTIAAHSQGFFKTGKGEYGEGDQFLGIRVPYLRKLAKRFQSLSLHETQRLIMSPLHEQRLCVVLIWVLKYQRGDAALKKAIYETYLAHTQWINNWDLVDSSAHKIVGDYLFERSRKPLFKLASSKDLWERRVAIMSTLHMIKKDDFQNTLDIAEQLLNDNHDLIHKAVGWMLREVGNRDRLVEEAFLSRHYRSMPRTMLRYAIEKFSQEERRAYLSGKVS